MVPNLFVAWKLYMPNGIGFGCGTDSSWALTRVVDDRVLVPTRCITKGMADEVP
jgi:hypothetical protein